MKKPTTKKAMFITLVPVTLNTSAIGYYVFILTKYTQSAKVVILGFLLIVFLLVANGVLLWGAINLAYARGKLDMIKQLFGKGVENEK